MDAAIARTPASTDSMPASVIMDIHKIVRNNKVWTDPDEFRPERFLTGGAADATGAPVRNSHRDRRACHRDLATPDGGPL